MGDSRTVFGKELTFDAEKHAYQWGGALVPGVTSILSCIGKPLLVPWASGMASDYWLQAIKDGRTDYSILHKEAKGAHRRKAKDAANIGHNVHDYAECFFKKQELPTLKTDQAKRGVEAFHKWFNSHKIKILASERRLFSRDHYYAGTCDFVAEIDGVMGVGDIKTSSGIYPEMRFQTAAYQQALQEEKNVKFPVRWIIRFDKKTGEFEAKSFYDFDLDISGFLASLKLHKVLQTIDGEK
jgi:hypothetical protein